VDDEEQLGFVPFMNHEAEGQEEEADRELDEGYELTEREKRLERGPIFQEDLTNELIDTTLERILATAVTNRSIGNGREEDRAHLLECAGHCLVASERLLEFNGGLHIDLAWMMERIQKVMTNHIPEARPADTAPQDSLATPPVEQPAQVALNQDSAGSAFLESYQKRIVNFRDLFCNRCFMYDCPLHGQYTKPELELQAERAARRAEHDFWKVIIWGTRGMHSASVDCSSFANFVPSHS